MSKRRTAPARRITRARAWGRNCDGVTEIRLARGWVDGAYEVWHKGDCIAQTTDRWMAELIMAEVTR